MNTITLLIFLLFQTYYCRLANQSTKAVDLDGPIDCKNDVDKLDDLARKIGTYGDPVRNYPKNNQEMTEFCLENRNYINWVQNYSRTCLKSPSRHAANLLIYATQKLIKKYCHSGQKTRDAYISYHKCGNAAKSKTVACWDQELYDLQAILLVENHKIKIPLFCCIYHKAYYCSQNAYEDMGTRTCPQRSIDGLLNVFEAASSDFLNYYCGEYRNDNDKCVQLMKSLPKVDPNNNLPKSMILIGIQIFDSLPEF